MAFKEKKKVVHLDQEAWEKKVRKRRILIAALLAGILVGLVASYIIRKVLPDKARSKAYSEAEAAIAAGNIAEGIEGFTLLDGYKDSAKRAVQAAYAECGSDFDYLKDAKVGDIIEFGRYEQDNIERNGQEPIQWGVMMKTKTALYLMAVNVLDEHPYHTDKGAITWADCEMRTWLNGDFLNTAFNEKEQLLIAKSKVTTAKNSVSGAKGGKDTEDKVFLMSHEELITIIRSGAEINLFGLYAYPTKYALSRGIEPAGYGTAMWWMRTPGSKQDNVTVTDAKGEPVYVKRPNYKGVGVRPCILVLIDGDEG